MIERAPLIDPRTAAKVAEDVKKLVTVHLPQWKPDQDRLGTALIAIFARFAELVIERLNQAPDKNFLAFLDLLGAARLPPQPARAPLTFALAENATVDAVVPAGTQVGATPPAGDQQALLFETERDLVVTSARLQSLFVRDPLTDRYADRSAILSAEWTGEAPAFEGERAIDHSFYLGHQTLLACTAIKELKLLDVKLEKSGDPLALRWEIWDGNEGIDLSPEDHTAGLSKNGSVVFKDPGTFPERTVDTLTGYDLRLMSVAAADGLVNEGRNLVIVAVVGTDLHIRIFDASGKKVVDKAENELVSGETLTALKKQLTPIPDESGLSKEHKQKIIGDATSIAGHTPLSTLTSRWLRCRLETAIELKRRDKTKELIPAVNLPTIKDLTLSVVAAGGAPDAAYANALPLDLGKEVFPFGEKPKLGDSFYLSHREAFSKAGATVTLRLSVVDPKWYTQVAAIPTERKPTLLWEFWKGQAWAALTPTKDDSASFTATGPRTVEFTVPAIQPAIINGVENYWIRVRISSGDYGKDAGIHLKTDANGQPRKDADGQLIFTLQPSTLVPPQLAGLSVGYTQAAKPEVIVTVNDFVSEQKVAGTFQPFLAPTETGPALYLGFRLPAGRAAFPNRPLSLYFSVAETEHRYKAGSDTPSSAPALAWEYWNGRTWAGTIVQDGTDTLIHSGIVGWLAPADIARKADFGLPECYWLRLRLAGGAYPHPPRLQRLFLNTTMAAQTMTLMNEVLGSSDGNTGQCFRTNHAPVLPGQQLEVQESEMPTALEQAEIRRSEGQDAIRASETTGPHTAVWVRWHEVPDFHGSAPRDRHYVLDRLTGEIRFGDGNNGLIPPRGIGNIRLARYRTGGGRAGNKPAGTVIQLQTTVPYIDKVTNHEPASGGAEAETEDALLKRAPTTLRHHERAVTVEDFEDLALLASPEVARALCVPLLNLDNNPLEHVDTEEEQKAGAGQIGVIIVPRSAEPKPLPDRQLIRRVRDYLVKHAIATATLSLAGPLYLSINVTMDVVLQTPEGASAVKPMLYQELTAFFHPLTGGQQGAGWPFGERPQESDVYRLIAEVPGIDYVRALTVNMGAIEEANAGKDAVNQIMATHRFLIYSGRHKITLSFEGR